MIKLNIGGQQTRDRFPAGWTCIDILPGADIIMDISKEKLPFADNSVDAIYCSHVLEHIWMPRHKFVVDEFYRVLKKDGVIRIVVPDMDIAVNEYIRVRDQNNPLSIAGLCGWWFNPTINGLTGEVELNHVGGFNWCSLKHLFETAGFQQCLKSCYGICLAIFGRCDNPGHKNTSVYLEAYK